MAEKRKISVRKIIQLVLTAVVAVCCVIAMVSASSIEGERALKGMPVVHIKNSRKYQFIEQQKIMKLAFYNRNIDIAHTPVSRLDLLGIEQAIMADPWVADAQVFIDIDRVMHLYVTQRVPVARIFKQDGDSYYIDGTLHTMPLSDNYTYYTTIVTNAPPMGNDSAGMALKQQIVTLIKTIHADSFWNAQISQVVVDSAGMFELVPVLGNQRILFGDTTRMKEKFGNLVSFYRNVLNKIGWDKYETLDVRFRGQVVAAPSLPYKGPVDKAIANMNWITSIEITEAQKDSLKAMEAKGIGVAKVAAPKVVEKQEPQQKPKAVAPVKATAAKSTTVAKTVPANAKATAAKASATVIKAAMVNAKTSQQPGKAKAAGGNVKAKEVAKGNNKQKAAKQNATAKGKTNTVATKPAKANATAKKPAAKTTAKKNVKLPAKAAKKTDNKKKRTKATDKKKNSKEKGKEGRAAKYVYPEKKK